jgi:hypothetical protein
MSELCGCEQIIEQDSALPECAVVHYDGTGNLVYAMCVHGRVLVNNEKEETI